METDTSAGMGDLDSSDSETDSTAGIGRVSAEVETDTSAGMGDLDSSGDRQYCWDWEALNRNGDRHYCWDGGFGQQ